MSIITVVGAGIGRQFINGDPNRYEWRVSYEIDGRGLYYHTVSSRDAHDSQDAIVWAKLELDQRTSAKARGLGAARWWAARLSPAARLPEAQSREEQQLGRCRT
jgi:hypothetical protein